MRAISIKKRQLRSTRSLEILRSPVPRDAHWACTAKARSFSIDERARGKGDARDLVKGFAKSNARLGGLRIEKIIYTLARKEKERVSDSEGFAGGEVSDGRRCD
jgi:hypothetical protein